MYKYAIVSAVYNVESYLKDFLKSITRQTLGFTSHIQLIMIDDGSTDSSMQIIKEWQQKYPNNIMYFYQKNGGQASARNLGLEQLASPWVTFIDPDDFIDKRYFETVDKAIHTYKDSNLTMIGCNIIYYFERLKFYLDRHPLNYRFKNGNTHCAIKEMNSMIHLATNTAFFRTDLIRKFHLTFDTKIKPNFEDAHFVNHYLIDNFSTGSVAFLKDAKYYYRRRRSKNSTIDTSWRKKELFDDVLRYGCLDLFETAEKKLGHIPKFLQRTVLYHLSWYYKYIVDRPETVTFLDDEQQKRFQVLLRKNFTYIDLDSIKKFDLSGIETYIKEGWAAVYKHTSLHEHTLYLHKNRERLFCYYYALEPKSLSIEIDHEQKTTPVPEIETHTFLDEVFIRRFLYTLPLKEHEETLAFRLDGSPIRLKTGDDEHLDTIACRLVKKKKNYILKKLFYNTGRKLLLGN